MNTCKLIFRNVCKNIRDYLIYFLTLTLSVSLFYAFNSISDQPAFSNMGMTGTLLYRQLGIMLSTLSTMIAVVLAFLILYANQFLLKRRKKELGVYMMLGMKKGRIAKHHRHMAPFNWYGRRNYFSCHNRPCSTKE